MTPNIVINDFLLFQDGGALLCIIDESNEHNISVWDWQKGEKGFKLAENKVSLTQESGKLIGFMWAQD